MGITNGQPVDEDFTNPAFLDRRLDDTAFGRITLDNTTDSLSGEIVVNVQRHINEGHQDEKAFLYTAGNSKMSFDGFDISLSEDLLIGFPDGPFVNSILAANFPLSIADGYHVYVTVDRYASVSVTPTVAAVLPKGKDIYRIATRVGDAIILRGGIMIFNGAAARIGQSGGGVSSLAVTSEGVPTEGDLELEEGANVTIMRAGKKFKISALGAGGGGGGGGITYSENTGSVTIKLKPPTKTLVLMDSSFVLWDVLVANDGTVSTVSGSSGTPNNAKFTKPDLSEAIIGINTDGTLFVTSPPPGGETLDDQLFVESPDGEAWRFTVNNSNEYQVESDTTDSNSFTVTNDRDNVLFKVQETGSDRATQYVSLYTAATLPSSPASVTNCLPWAFYDSGSFKRPIYWDGSVWRYFHDNSTV